MAVVLFIVGNSAALTAAETQLRDDILAAGHSLGSSNAFIVSDETVTSANLTGKDVVVISEATSSTTVNTQIGAALASWSGIIVTGNPGFGIIPTLGIAYGASINTYRATASSMTLVDIPDTIYDDALNADDVSYHSPASPGAFIRTAYLGTGAVVAAFEVNETTTAAAVVYPSGATLADQANQDNTGGAAPGARVYVTLESWANRTLTARQFVFDGILDTLVGSVGPTPTVGVRSRTIVDGESVNLTAEIDWSGNDTTAGVTWSTTDPAGVGTIDDVNANPATVTPTSTGATYTATVVGVLGGQASAVGTVTLLDTDRQQVAPESLAGTAGVQAAGGGTALASALADASDTTAVDLTTADDVLFVRLADLADPATGTGSGLVDLHVTGNVVSAVARVEVVDASGVTDAQARDGSGTVVGASGGAAEVTVTATSPLTVTRALSSADVAALDPADTGIRVTLVSATTA